MRRARATTVCCSEGFAERYELDLLRQRSLAVPHEKPGAAS